MIFKPVNFLSNTIPPLIRILNIIPSTVLMEFSLTFMKVYMRTRLKIIVMLTTNEVIDRSKLLNVYAKTLICHPSCRFLCVCVFFATRMRSAQCFLLYVSFIIRNTLLYLLTQTTNKFAVFWSV